MTNSESLDIKSPSLGGNYTPKLVAQKFIIVGTDHENKKDYLKRTEAQASFMYKDFIISMATTGLNHGEFLTEVKISKYEKDLIYAETVHNTHTVEDAINWVNENSE